MSAVFLLFSNIYNPGDASGNVLQAGQLTSETNNVKTDELTDAVGLTD